MSAREINLLPWRCWERQKKRAFWIRQVLWFFIVVSLGSFGLHAYWENKIQYLQKKNAEITQQKSAQKEAQNHERLLNTWWTNSVKEHQQFIIFLRIIKNSSLPKDFQLQEARFEPSQTSPASMSWIGVTNSKSLSQWLAQVSEELPGVEIQLVDMKRALGQVQFEAQARAKGPVENKKGNL